MANKRFLLGSESQLFEYASTNKPVNITIDQFTRFLHPSIQTDMKAKCIFIKVSVTSILILAILSCIMLKIFITKKTVSCHLCFKLTYNYRDMFYAFT